MLHRTPYPKIQTYIQCILYYIEPLILDTNLYTVYPILHRTPYPRYKLIYSVS